MIKWNLFEKNELEEYEAMLQRLYLNDCQKVVMRYEKYRAALNHQLKLKQKANTNHYNTNISHHHNHLHHQYQQQQQQQQQPNQDERI